MAFSAAVITEITSAAVRLNIEPAALLAVAFVEGGGSAGAIIAGRLEPLIRFEGHYFYKRLKNDELAAAKKAGLASPTAGAIPNPSTQEGRWRMLNAAMQINAQAALESCSWGLGQVMGAHWDWLGFGSVTEFVNMCRSGAAGQAEVMARYIDRAGLAGALRSHDWAAFARGYNGPAYMKNAYHTKMAQAYAKFKGAASDDRMRQIQEMLTAAGFAVAVDGIAGPKTTAAVQAFQKAHGLVSDGIVGSATWAALEEASTKPASVSAPSTQTPVPPATTPAPAAPSNSSWFARIFRAVVGALGKKSP